MGFEEWVDSSTGLTVWRSWGRGVVKILPDAHADLIFWRGRWVIAGYDTAVHAFDRGHGSTTFGLRLPHGALPALLRAPATRAVDRRIDLADVDPGLERRLRRACASPPSMAGALCDVAGEVAERLLEVSNERANGVAASLAAEAGAVAATARAFDLSKRTLRRYCLSIFGISPVLLRQILQFQRAVGLLRAGVPPAEAAARASYADQAHLCRAVRRFAATTPASIRKS